MENKWINKFPVLATFICMAKLWVCLPLRLSHPFWEKCTADFLVRAWQVSLSLIAKSSERHESVENGNEVCCDLHNTRHHTEPTCFPRVASFPTPETLAHYLHWQYRIQTSLWGAKRPETTVTGLTRHEDYIKQTLFILLSSTDTINIESRYLFCFAAGFCLAFFCVCVCFMHPRPRTKCTSKFNFLFLRRAGPAARLHEETNGRKLRIRSRC